MEEKNKKKTLRTFAIASFLNDLGSDMIYPVWPLFLTTVLHADMAVVGLIDGLGDAVVSISQAVSGYLSDRLRKRKIFIWTGYLFGSVSRAGYAFSAAWQHVIPFRILDRAGKIRGAPRDAIIADISTRENRGRNFGFLRAMDNMGAVCGILITVLFFGLLGYRNLFLLASIPSALGAGLIIARIRERKAPRSKIYPGIRLRELDRNLGLFLLLSSFFALGSFSYSFLLIYAKEFGFRVTSIPLLYLIFTIAASVFSLPAGKLSDRVGRKNVLLMSYLLWAMVCISFIYLRSGTAIIFAFVLYGLHKGALETVQKAFVSELAPKEHRASILGGFQMVVGVSALPASLIAGVLWDRFDMAMPFYFSAALTLASIALLFFVKEKG